MLTAMYWSRAKSTEPSSLEDQIASQTDKVRVLEQVLQSSAQKNGESSKKNMEWQASLNKAKVELIRMEAALRCIGAGQSRRSLPLPLATAGPLLSLPGLWVFSAAHTLVRQRSSEDPRAVWVGKQPGGKSAKDPGDHLDSHPESKVTVAPIFGCFAIRIPPPAA